MCVELNHDHLGRLGNSVKQKHSTRQDAHVTVKRLHLKENCMGLDTVAPPGMLPSATVNFQAIQQ